MTRWVPLATDDDGTPDTKFIVDNDVDIEFLHWVQGHGISVVQLPVNMRALPDEDVLAEAKRQDRVLFTHDRRFVNPQSVNTEVDVSWVPYVPSGIIYEAPESFAIAMRRVPLDIGEQFVSKFFLGKTFASHLGLDHDLLGFKEKVHPRRLAT